MIGPLVGLVSTTGRLALLLGLEAEVTKKALEVISASLSGLAGAKRRGTKYDLPVADKE